MPRPPFVRLALVLALAAGSAEAAPVLVNALAIAGDASDLSGLPAGPNGSRLGGFGSDLYYDRYSNTYYGIADRGPGGGLLPYATRVQRFTLDADAASGAISNFQLVATTPFTAGGQALNLAGRVNACRQRHQQAPALATALISLNSSAMYLGHFAGSASGGAMIAAAGYAGLNWVALAWMLASLGTSVWAAGRLRALQHA